MKNTIQNVKRQPSASDSKTKRLLKRSLMSIATASILTSCGANGAGRSDSATTATGLNQPREIQLKGTAAMLVITAERKSEGQTQIDLERYQEGGERMVRATANVSGRNLEYNWLFYRDIGRGNQLLMNPDYGEGSQPAYIGTVMRNITLTDGRSGDFVVRVYANQTRTTEGPEFGPVVESNGRVSPKNVLYPLEAGSLVPDVNSINFRETCTRTTVPQASVREFGQTTPVVLVRQQ